MLFTEGAYSPVTMPCTFSSALCRCLEPPWVPWMFLSCCCCRPRELSPQLGWNVRTNCSEFNCIALPSRKEPAFRGRKAFKVVIVARHWTDQYWWIFQVNCLRCSHAEVLPKSVLFLCFLSPQQLGQYFSFLLLKIFQQNLQLSSVLCDLYRKTWSIPTRILTGSCTEPVCNLNKAIAGCDSFEEMCNHWYHFSHLFSKRALIFLHWYRFSNKKID